MPGKLCDDSFGHKCLKGRFVVPSGGPAIPALVTALLACAGMFLRAAAEDPPASSWSSQSQPFHATPPPAPLTIPSTVAPPELPPRPPLPPPAPVSTLPPRSVTPKQPLAWRMQAIKKALPQNIPSTAPEPRRTAEVTAEQSFSRTFQSSLDDTFMTVISDCPNDG